MAPEQEQFLDVFAVPATRWDRPAVAALRAILASPEACARLDSLGIRAGESNDES